MSRLKASFSWVQASNSFSHAAFSAAMIFARSALLASETKVFFSKRLVNAIAAALASPQIPTEIFFTKPNILLSASI